MTSEKTLKTLEFDKIRVAAAAYADSPRGAAAVKACVPSARLDEALEKLEYTRQAYTAMYDVLVTPSMAVDDVGEIVSALSKQAVLSPSDLLKVAALLRCASGFVSAQQKLPKEGFGKIEEAAASLYLNGALREDIEAAIVGENEIADGASAKLRDIRREIRGVLQLLAVLQKIAGHADVVFRRLPAQPHRQSPMASLQTPPNPYRPPAPRAVCQRQPESSRP